MTAWVISLGTVGFVFGLIFLIVKFERLAEERERRKVAEAAAKAVRKEAEIYAKPRPDSWTDTVGRL